MRLALYQPDIPQNTGTILRLAACLGVDVDLIGPAGFDMTDRALRRAGLDYIDKLQIRRHLSWEDFRTDHGSSTCPDNAVSNMKAVNGKPNSPPTPGRLVLLTTRAQQSYLDFRFRPDDILLLGRESAGVPASVHESVNARIMIPMQPGFRSLNIAVSAAMVLGEALRQTGGFSHGCAEQG